MIQNDRIYHMILRTRQKAQSLLSTVNNEVVDPSQLLSLLPACTYVRSDAGEISIIKDSIFWAASCHYSDIF